MQPDPKDETLLEKATFFSNDISTFRADNECMDQMIGQLNVDSSIQDDDLSQENDTNDRLTDRETGSRSGTGTNILLLSSLNSAWKSYRLSSYLTIIESLLARGGCEVSMQHALALLRDMVKKEGLLPHQSQIRSLVHYAILHDLGPGPVLVFPPLGDKVALAPHEKNKSRNKERDMEKDRGQFNSPPYPSSSIEISQNDENLLSTYGNGVRILLALRELVPTKPDDVLYKMVLKSLIKRRKRIQLKVARQSKLAPSQLDRTQHPTHPTLQDFDSSRVQVPDESDPSPDSDLSSLNQILLCMKEDGIKASTHIHREVDGLPLFLYCSFHSSTFSSPVCLLCAPQSFPREKDQSIIELKFQCEHFFPKTYIFQDH